MIDVLRFDAVRVPLHGGGTAGPWSFRLGFGSVLAVEAPPSVADTVVRLCVGGAPAASGSVEVLGLDPAALSRFPLLALRRRMGVAFQREGLVSNLSLRENLAVPLVYTGRLRAREARAVVDRALETLGLEGHASRRPTVLSREARIVATVARAALGGPEVLLVEHLLSGLPPGDARTLVGWCRERCGSMLLLQPTRDSVLDGAVDGWLDPLAASDAP